MIVESLVDPAPTLAGPIGAMALLSYLLGALPFGLLIARMKGVDLRQVGSGNIGATNTMRAIGKSWGLTAFALDVAKGWVPVAVFAWMAVGVPDGPDGDQLPMARVVCGTAAVLGHCFPVYLKFKGGKGVATGCGAIVAIDPWVFLAGGVVWLASMAMTRFVGLSSILMGATFPVAAWVLLPADRPFLVGCSLLTALIVVRHRSNIARMLAGEEPRMGRSRDEAKPPHG